MSFWDVALRSGANVVTPAYTYDLTAMEREAEELAAAFGDHAHAIFYAVKANSAGSIVRALASRGCGADVVTGAELAFAAKCGIDAERIVFSGVAKSDDEIDLAIAYGNRGIRAIQVESIEEITRVNARASAANRVVRIAIRVNPELDLEELATHAHVATGHDEAKFGIVKNDLPHAFDAIASAKNVTLVGISSHVGSQFFVTAPYVKAARAVCEIARGVREKTPLEFVDTGGGFGVDYSGEPCARPAEFVRAALAVMKEERVDDLAIHVEPGRSLVARHGVILARVIQKKVSPSSGKRWLMIDAGMNDLIRPALYQAKHRIIAATSSSTPKIPMRVVGPICESSDDFGEHLFPDEDFTHVVILDAGAYGFTMASRYNGRALASEIFMRNGTIESMTERAPIDAWAEERARA